LEKAKAFVAQLTPEEKDDMVVSCSLVHYASCRVVAKPIPRPENLVHVSETLSPFLALVLMGSVYRTVPLPFVLPITPVFLPLVSPLPLPSIRS
jgi:hypothetical protein